MKGKTSLRALIGLVAVVAIVVGVLVWPTPKEARAEVRYNVDLWCDAHDFAGNNAIVMMRFEVGEVWSSWVPADVVDGANYFVHQPAAVDQWQVSLPGSGPYSDEEDPLTIDGLTTSYGWWNVTTHTGSH